MAAGESDATDQPLQAAVIADAVTMANSEMLAKMQAIAESAGRAAKAAEDAAESAKQRSDGFKSVEGSVHEPPQTQQQQQAAAQTLLKICGSIECSKTKLDPNLHLWARLCRSQLRRTI